MNYKHGKTGTKLFRVWCSMKERCQTKTHKNYKNYGGRGINICDEWQEFKTFEKWAFLNGYKSGLQIDRINNNCGYNPENCRFVTIAENTRNTRLTKLSMKKAVEIRMLYHNGCTQKEIGKIFGISRSYVSQIINHKRWATI